MRFREIDNMLPLRATTTVCYHYIRHLTRKFFFGALCAIATLACIADSARAGAIDTFAISLEEPVSDGVPGPGAGNIEAAGNLDRYLLTVPAGTLVYFDETFATGCQIVWTCRRPDNSVIFSNNALCVGDPGTIELAQGGTYTIEVTANNNGTGTYAFTIWAVNPADEFTIDLKEVVSSGVPGPGAGNIEEPGAVDRYFLEIEEPDTLVYFDELNASACAIIWTCRDPAGVALFSNNAVCVSDPGAFTLASPGTYTIEVSSGNTSVLGTYSFTTWIVNPTETFPIALKQTVSNGNPAPGAGNIEEPGAMDAYTFSVEPGTAVYFDELSASACGIGWRCRAPDASVVFSDSAMCVADPGEFVLDQAGTYTIEVFGQGGAIGTYSFVLLEVNPTETFSIALEQTMSDGQPGPGAGNIEEPNAVDEYLLTVTAGTQVYFDELGAASCALQWTCIAPDGSTVFALNSLCVPDPGVFTLDQAGTYVLRAKGSNGATGTYSFIVWEVNPPEEFDLALDELVSNGLPARGAGNIEEPGAIDRYTLTLPANTLACFEELSGPCDLQWSCETPSGASVFENEILCTVSPGKFLLAEAGEYIITVRGQTDGAGAYSLIVHTGRAADIDGNCAVNVDDLIAVILAWGACANPGECPADVDGNGAVDVDDLIAVILNWG